MVLVVWKPRICYTIYSIALNLETCIPSRLLVGVNQYGSSTYYLLPSSVLQYIAILQYMTRNHFMGTSCTQLHMFYHFYVANKADSQRQALIITFNRLFVIFYFSIC